MRALKAFQQETPQTKNPEKFRVQLIDLLFIKLFNIHVLTCLFIFLFLSKHMLTIYEEEKWEEIN